MIWRFSCGPSHGMSSPAKSTKELELFDFALCVRIFVHEHLPAPCAQKAIRSSTTATMSSADQNSHISAQRGAGPSTGRSNQSKIPQKFGGRGRGGGRGKKRDMGRSEWRCVRYNDRCWHGREIDWLKQNESG